MRAIHHVYQDPLEVLWTQTARELGIEVKRDSTVFAHWDGEGTLRIGTPETLDADDSLAQMIFHEVCHALVEGPDAFKLPDWGLENDPSRRVHEHACLRLQAVFSDAYGLRSFLAATTMFRSYYDQLPENPLESVEDPAVELALAGWERARQGPWAAPLDRALRLTSKIAEVIDEIAPESSLWSVADGRFLVR
jgi:hypothetical protein